MTAEGALGAPFFLLCVIAARVDYLLKPGGWRIMLNTVQWGNRPLSSCELARCILEKSRKSFHKILSPVSVDKAVHKFDMSVRKRVFP
jgi:hypothetical protein